MATIVEEFDSISIKNAGIQLFNDDGTKAAGTKFGAIGSIEGSTTLRELIKRLEGVEVRKRTKPEKMDLTISAHIPVQVARDIFGISNADLKPGIYKYSKTAKGKEFVFTADVIDEFEEVTKLIAFPKATTSTGFSFSIENGADEVAQMEVSLTAYPDEQGNLMYDAFVAELTDATIATTWHQNFDYTLVKVPVV